MILGSPPPVYDPKNEAQMRAALERADQQNLKRGVAASEWLLQAPNGTVYRGTISNAGALTWTAL